MADFVHLLGFYGHKIHIQEYIELKETKNMLIDSTKRIKLVLLKNIAIWPIYGPKSL